MTLIAINILLDSDPATLERAQATIARLRRDYPDGFALAANNAPHITLLQRFVRTAIGLYEPTYNILALVGIVIEPTEDVIRLQQRMIDAIAPFAVEKGTGEAFAPRPDCEAISQTTVDDVKTFVGPRTGLNNHLI